MTQKTDAASTAFNINTLNWKKMELHGLTHSFWQPQFEPVLKCRMIWIIQEPLTFLRWPSLSLKISSCSWYSANVSLQEYQRNRTEKLCFKLIWQSEHPYPVHVQSQDSEEAYEISPHCPLNRLFFILWKEMSSNLHLAPNKSCPAIFQTINNTAVDFKIIQILIITNKTIFKHLNRII